MAPSTRSRGLELAIIREMEVLPSQPHFVGREGSRLTKGRVNSFRLGLHDPADVLLLDIVAGQWTSQATAAIAQWARSSSLTVTSIDDPVVGVRASTKRIASVLRVAINDYRLPGGYMFRANDRGPSVPTSLSINAIAGLSTYTQASLPGPLVAATPTP